MNKAQIIEEIARLTNVQKNTVKDVLESFIGVVGKTLKQDSSVVLTGFGTFKVMKRKARVGVNPATGQKMQIPARRVPKFTAGKALKDLVG